MPWFWSSLIGIGHWSRESWNVHFFIFSSLVCLSHTLFYSSSSSPPGKHYLFNQHAQGNAWNPVYTTLHNTNIVCYRGCICAHKDFIGFREPILRNNQSLKIILHFNFAYVAVNTSASHFLAWKPFFLQKNGLFSLYCAGKLQLYGRIDNLISFSLMLSQSRREMPTCVKSI